jgi:hypothetical protein
MKRWHLSGILASMAVLAFSASAANKPLDVRDLMTVNQFRSAGLGTLSDAQMKSLNADILNLSVDAAAKGVDLENILTTDEFHADGLDTLTPDQRASLDAWVTGYLRSQSQAEATASAAGAAAPAAATGTASFGASMLKSDAGEPNSIHSSIVGKFTGWSGSTIFKLANGQVWQQSEPDDYDTLLMNPPVVIKKLHFGYLLTLPGNGKTVFVTRIH